ncbi:multisubunit sodium/proton antiporter MrpG subunit [Actinomadura hallensis]|uniref:Multisubunit sodium/proton antiporter MrpG subunit n=1 Tax=Actinomadura hallensis TaxID=337895 RepID=A0A543II70_9ACTN|nr:monovalent cation/H(+) antiporter subunit G [Actinomadura hallensis]TQM70247.1 multisubunit sodium/proton antiporter MrpG subunit [Actinomadura hallensis]
MSAADVITAILLPTGALFSALGALGALRFPDLLSRLHAATKPQTIGLLLILTGVAFQAGSFASAAPLILVAFFQLLTAPVTAQTVGGAAWRAGVIDRGVITVDDSRREESRREESRRED